METTMSTCRRWARSSLNSIGLDPWIAFAAKSLSGTIRQTWQMEHSDSELEVSAGNHELHQGPAASRLLLCTLCCPWPDRREQGLYNQEYAASLGKVGVSTTLFAPGPTMPRCLRRWHRLRSHASRPQEYRLGDVPVIAPRIPFAFPRAVREASRRGASSLVSRAFKRAVQKPLQRAVATTRPSAILLHGAHPWGRVGCDVALKNDIDAYIVEHSADDLRRAYEFDSLGAVYRDANQRCAGWITVSDVMRDLILQVVPDANVTVIANGASRLTEPAARPAEFEGKTVFFAAAHYYRRKGLEELVEAFTPEATGTSDAVLAIATDAPPELERAIGELGDRAHLLGALGHREVLKWMHWADVFVLLSRAEAFGIVYAEALCAGTPVILSGDCGIAKSLRLLGDEPARADFDGWSVDLDCPQGIAIALGHAAAGAELLVSMGMSAKARAMPRFNWEQTARRLADAIGLAHH